MHTQEEEEGKARREERKESLLPLQLSVQNRILLFIHAFPKIRLGRISNRELVIVFGLVICRERSRSKDVPNRSKRRQVTAACHHGSSHNDGWKV